MTNELNPKGQIRECCETEEHPSTVPVILALDVTGSMGQAALEVASKLHQIVSSVLNEIKDAEFLIMGLGDLAYDRCPIQASQFESDVRTAKNLDSIFFESGGGTTRGSPILPPGTSACTTPGWTAGSAGAGASSSPLGMNRSIPSWSTGG